MTFSSAEYMALSDGIRELGGRKSGGERNRERREEEGY